MDNTERMVIFKSQWGTNSPQEVTEEEAIRSLRAFNKEVCDGKTDDEILILLADNPIWTNVSKYYAMWIQHN